MFVVVLLIAALGAILAVAWLSMAVVGRGPSRQTGGAVVVLLVCCALALLVFLAGDDEFEEGSRWSAQGAHEVTELVTAGAVLAGVLALIALRRGGPRRVLSAISAAATFAALGGLSLIALVHSIHLS